MATQINALNCKKVKLGTGLIPCEIRFRQPKTILRTDPSWSFDPATETFNLAYVVSKIQDGTFTPFKNTIEFTENTADPTTQEYQGGDTFLVRNGKPTYAFAYDNGVGFHKAAYSYNGNRQNSVILVDKVGNVGVLSNVAGTKLSAHLTNMFNTRTMTMEAGDTSARTTLEFQIANEEAFNSRFTVISVDEIGADLNEEIDGIISVNIEGTAAAGDPIEITVMGENNSIYGIEGLTASNFRVRNAVTNAVVTLTSVTAGATPGAYTLTPTTPTVAAQKLIVETYDDDADVAVALVGDTVLYKGESPEITVSA